MQATRRSMGDRAFAVAGLRAWNSLPEGTHHSLTLFKDSHFWTVFSLSHSVSIDCTVVRFYVFIDRFVCIALLK